MPVTWNNVQHGKFLRPFKNKYTIFWVEVVSDLNYEFCYCVDIAVNQILTKYGHLVQWNCDCFGEAFKDCASPSPNKIWSLVAVPCDCLFWESQTNEHHQNPTKYGHLVQ